MRFAVAAAAVASLFLSIDASAQVARGSRVLSIDVGAAADGNYDEAMDVAKGAGAQAVSLSLDWRSIETGVCQYDNTKLVQANGYYPSKGIAVTLMLRPVSTNQLTVPADLQGVPFDDPHMVLRFEWLLDDVFGSMPNVNVLALYVGSEVDDYFGDDAAAWARYRSFYQQVADYARARHPGLRVGVEGTLGGLIAGSSSVRAQNLWLANQHSDVIAVSYYPLGPGFAVEDPSVVPYDFYAVAANYPGRPVYFNQCGYPAGYDQSSQIGSSTTKQWEFVYWVFRAWDQNPGQIALVNFTWQTDVSPSTLALIEQAYGTSDPRFVEYIATLGLRWDTQTGTDKPAWQQLGAEAHARGW